MKSLAIFLTLAFLTGFQAAVLSEELPPTNSEPDQSVLEQWQEQLGKISTQVTDSLNEGLGMMKGHASDVAAYTMEWVKKYTPSKLPSRKIGMYVRDLQQYGQSAVSQSKEVVKDQYKKAVEKLDEIKKLPAVTTLNEELFQPVLSKCSKAASWFTEQSPASLYNLLQKKMSF